MLTVTRRLATLVAPSIALLVAACGGSRTEPQAQPSPSPSPSAVASTPADTPVPPGGVAPRDAAAEKAPGTWKPCAEATCRSVASPGAALASILEGEKPLVVGFGEAHAQKGTEAIASTPWRTTHELLPELGGKASDLVLELWIPDKKCAPKAQAKVAEQQQEVTKTQATSNTNEYVVLAEKAKALGMQPHVIRPTCAEVDKIAKAGDDAVLEMLSMITDHMKRQIEDLRSKPAAKDKIVVTYGGALHNDLVPGPGREGWTFGPAIDAATGHRYVEIDLVVPEYVKDTPAWTGQRWYAAHQATKADAGTTVIKTGDHAYAIILPRGVGRPE
jgi:hypothetical protein